MLKNTFAFLTAIVLVISAFDGKKTSNKTPYDQQIGHVVLQVSNLERAQDFYENVLHMHTNEEAFFKGERRIFLSSNDAHHELVLKGGLKAGVPVKKRYLQQLAIEVKDHEQLVEYYNELKEKNIDFELKDNQVAWSIYLYGPDSVYIELYWDIRDQPFGKNKWNGDQQDLSVDRLMAVK